MTYSWQLERLSPGGSIAPLDHSWWTTLGKGDQSVSIPRSHGETKFLHFDLWIWEIMSNFKLLLRSKPTKCLKITLALSECPLLGSLAVGGADAAGALLRVKFHLKQPLILAQSWHRWTWSRILTYSSTDLTCKLWTKSWLPPAQPTQPLTKAASDVAIFLGSGVRCNILTQCGRHWYSSVQQLQRGSLGIKR